MFHFRKGDQSERLGVDIRDVTLTETWSLRSHLFVTRLRLVGGGSASCFSPGFEIRPLFNRNLDQEVLYVRFIFRLRRLRLPAEVRFVVVGTFPGSNSFFFVCVCVGFIFPPPLFGQDDH